MPDREKVIAGLTILADRKNDNSCEGLKCCKIAEDALALLKEQEPVEPMIKTSHDGKGTWWYICGSCNTAVNTKDKYCRECGRELKWE